MGVFDGKFGGPMDRQPQRVEPRRLPRGAGRLANTPNAWTLERGITLTMPSGRGTGTGTGQMLTRSARNYNSVNHVMETWEEQTSGNQDSTNFRRLTEILNELNSSGLADHHNIHNLANHGYRVGGGPDFLSWINAFRMNLAPEGSDDLPGDDSPFPERSTEVEPVEAPYEGEPEPVDEPWRDAGFSSSLEMETACSSLYFESLGPRGHRSCSGYYYGIDAYSAWAACSRAGFAPEYMHDWATQCHW